MHRAARDISAAVFSQPCSEELDEDPPPYKPLPVASNNNNNRPKIPMTVAMNGNYKAAEVKKKLDELAQEVANQTLADEDNSDDEEYFGKCKDISHSF